MSSRSHDRVLDQLTEDARRFADEGRFDLAAEANVVAADRAEELGRADDALALRGNARRMLVHRWFVKERPFSNHTPLVEPVIGIGSGVSPRERFRERVLFRVRVAGEDFYVRVGPHGRVTRVKHDARPVVEFEVQRIPVDRGGYDKRGRYYGGGEPLFDVRSDLIPPGVSQRLDQGGHTWEFGELFFDVIEAPGRRAGAEVSTIVRARSARAARELVANELGVRGVPPRPRSR